MQTVPFMLIFALAALAVGLLTAVGNILATRVRVERERHDLLCRVAELRQNPVDRVESRRAAARAQQQAVITGFADVDILDDAADAPEADPPLAAAA